MTIYLYKKTHNVTGFKYLGKTVSKDPYSYTGSGVLWTRHLKKHGYDVTTEVLKECKTEQELIEWGLYYSSLWNVVESTEWANLKEEAGPKGSWSHQSRVKLSNSKKQELMKLTPKENAERIKRSCSSPASWTAQRIENMRKNMIGKKKTKTEKLLAAEAERKNRSLEQKMKCGDSNRGKTWKLVDGKRVWFERTPV